MDQETREIIQVLVDEIKQLKKINRELYSAIEKMSCDVDYLFREQENK